MPVDQPLKMLPDGRFAMCCTEPAPSLIPSVGKDIEFGAKPTNPAESPFAICRPGECPPEGWQIYIRSFVEERLVLQEHPNWPHGLWVAERQPIDYRLGEFAVDENVVGHAVQQHWSNSNYENPPQGRCYQQAAGNEHLAYGGCVNPHPTETHFRMHLVAETHFPDEERWYDPTQNTCEDREYSLPGNFQSVSLTGPDETGAGGIISRHRISRRCRRNSAEFGCRGDVFVDGTVQLHDITLQGEVVSRVSLGITLSAIGASYTGYTRPGPPWCINRCAPPAVWETYTNILSFTGEYYTP